MIQQESYEVPQREMPSTATGEEWPRASGHTRGQPSWKAALQGKPWGYPCTPSWPWASSVPSQQESTASWPEPGAASPAGQGKRPFLSIQVWTSGVLGLDLDHKYTLDPEQDRHVHTGTDPGKDHKDGEGSKAPDVRAKVDSLWRRESLGGILSMYINTWAEDTDRLFPGVSSENTRGDVTNWNTDNCI